MFIRKTDRVKEFVKQWLNASSIPQIITDLPSSGINHQEFADHRHDQSIFSMLVIDDKYTNLTNILGSESVAEDIFWHHRRRLDSNTVPPEFITKNIIISDNELGF